MLVPLCVTDDMHSLWAVHLFDYYDVPTQQAAYAALKNRGYWLCILLYTKSKSVNRLRKGCRLKIWYRLEPAKGWRRQRAAVTALATEQASQADRLRKRRSKAAFTYISSLLSFIWKRQFERREKSEKTKKKRQLPFGNIRFLSKTKIFPAFLRWDLNSW